MRGHPSRFAPLGVFLLCLSLTGCFGGKGGGGGNGGSGGGGGGGGPVYTATVTHQGNFTQGQQNATYTVTLTNIGGNFVSVNGNVFGTVKFRRTNGGLAGSRRCRPFTGAIGAIRGATYPRETSCYQAK